jgi:hypothetical protein
MLTALAIASLIPLKWGALPHGTVAQEQRIAHTLSTRWTEKVTPDNAHREYPRPQMVRKDWVNLNGLWDFGYIATGATSSPEQKRQILVPFPPESKLSGIEEMTPEGHALWYRRTFNLKSAAGKRTVLHFGASDWETSVFVDGKLAGTHRGGYDPFSFDITDLLRSDGDALSGSQLLSSPPSHELVVIVNDPTDKGPQPRGKQVLKPGGIFYRPTSGLWQTVWLEHVPESHVHSIRATTKINGEVNIKLLLAGPGGTTAEIFDGSKRIAIGRALPQAGDAVKTIFQEIDGQSYVEDGFTLRVTAPKLWSPSSPKLYRLKITHGEGKDADQVESYFGIREISLKKNQQGQPMVHLNGKPIFMFGPLDQGFWPDGLYAAPTDEALRYDVMVTKGLGFNMIRKHVKVEPQRWYYWCDKLGILVLQDMPSGDRFIGPNDPDIERTADSRDIYERELKAMIDNFRNHPSIIAWVPFNEGWGQFDTARIAKWIKDYDPTRLVDSASGWTDRKVGDFHDVHAYPGPGAPAAESSRASLLGEFGGYGLIVPNHTWQAEGWGYQSFKNKEELTKGIEMNFLQLRILKEEKGLSGAVYTQTTDVETELNGLLTYDRELIKPDTARLKAAIKAVYKPAPKLTEIVPTSEKTPAIWAYTQQKPNGDWTTPEYEAAGWLQGKGGFGTPETPGALVHTRWDTKDIWLRRTFDITSDIPTKDLLLRIHHDDDVEVYLDGKLILAKGGWTSSYTLIPWPSQTSILKKGRHSLAVYCHQNRGGQYIDIGIVKLK